MLHAQRRFPRALGALFLQSGSFFMPRYDAHERRFVALRRGSSASCARRCATASTRSRFRPRSRSGTAEENAHNNREMARALSAQGYELSLEEVPDLHNYVGWRDAFDPHLTTLLKRAWTR